ncbi:MAG: shikimate kinase [Anaerolineae bacterium]
MRYHNVVLAGFMGSGKSTVGPLVADQLGFRFVDTDAVIVQEAGRSIPQIFEHEGEAGFREREARICQHVAWEPDTVIATGGGALINRRTRHAILAHSMVIWLKVSLAEVERRVGRAQDRPLFRDPVRVRQLFQRRLPVYAGFPFHVETDGRAPQPIAEEIVRLWYSS